MSYSLYLLLRSEFKNIFPKYYSVISFVFTSLLTLFGYYCTSRALSPVSSLEGWHQANYFDYIVFGEIIITLPMAALLASTSAIKTMSHQGILENVIYNSKNPLHSLLTVSTSFLFKDCVYVLVHIFMAYALFGFGVRLENLLMVMFFVILSLPAFLLLGSLVGQVVLTTGRGAGILSNISYLIMLLSGVFFPIDVLPDLFKKLSLWLLPQANLLDFTRRLAAGENNLIISFFIYFTTWTLLTYIFNKYSMKYSIKRYPLTREYLENSR